MTTSRTAQTAPAVGRVLMSLIFVMSGLNKLFAWNQTAERMQQEGIVAVPLLLAGAIVFELGGGVSLLLGLHARLGAWALIVFLIPTTVIFHDFWAYSGQQQQQQMIHFMKNLTILGGLFVVAGFGPGCCSLDNRAKADKNSQSSGKRSA